ncbi:MAG: hypothetical protein GX237_02815 [Clostridiales bacterium]|nr:hypothetical protein [Clostridiales bacterium]
MKKIKELNTDKKVPMNKNTKILLYVLGGIFAVIAIIAVLIESASSQIIIRNNTDYKLKSVSTYFQDYNDIIGDKMVFEDIEKGQTVKKELDKMDFSYREATLRVAFEFEGQNEELVMFVDAGYFNDDFNGKVKIDFSDTEDGNVLLKVKASGGILPTPNIICDEEYTFSLDEGEIE